MFRALKSAKGSARRARQLSKRSFAKTAIIGGNLSAPYLLNKISPLPGQSFTIIAPDSHGWIGHFPRFFKLGQSVSTFRGSEDFGKEKITVEQTIRDWSDEMMKAVMPFEDEELNYIPGQVQGLKKRGSGNLLLTLTDGQELGFDRAIFLTGVGPERSLSSSGVSFLNRPMGPRVALDETTTALKAISQAERYFRDQNVLVLGGAATGAWVVELAIASGAKNVRWVAPRGFDAANPGGRNSEVMKLTEGSRTKANLETVKFLGDLSHGAGLEAALTEVDTGKQDLWKPDRIIAATGADPLAPTGIISVLGSEYNQIVPMHFGDGFFGRNPDGDVFVSSTALTGDLRKFGDNFAQVLKPLKPEAQVAAGFNVSRLSAEAVGKWISLQDFHSSYDPEITS